MPEIVTYDQSKFKADYDEIMDFWREGIISFKVRTLMVKMAMIKLRQSRLIEGSTNVMRNMQSQGELPEPR